MTASTHSAAIIPAGKAWIGTDRIGEGPATVVRIAGFAIDRFAVTNDRFADFIADDGYKRRELWDGEGFERMTSERHCSPAFWHDERFNLPDQPVTGTSFYEASAFAKWAGGRLPTEAEWEVAARGKDGRTFPWGESEPNTTLANFAPGFIPLNRAPRPVDEYPDGDSPYGCRQMAGNVYEWTEDFFHFDTPEQRAWTWVIEARVSARRVLKGGAWTTGADRLRASARWSYAPALRDNIVGFRVAYDLDAAQGWPNPPHLVW